MIEWLRLVDCFGLLLSSSLLALSSAIVYTWGRDEGYRAGFVAGVARDRESHRRGVKALLDEIEYWRERATERKT